MKKCILFVLFLIISGCISHSEELGTDFQSDFAHKECLPIWVWNIIYSKSLDETYDVSFHLNPYYLRGDFDGDNVQDTAVLIKNKISGEYGILIIHKQSNDIFIIGAGNTLGNNRKNFDWMDAWLIYDKGTVELGVGETSIPVLKGDALLSIKTESASGLIYWDGTSYQWYQQDD